MDVLIRQLLGSALMPLPVCIALGAVGWVLWSRGNSVRAGRMFVALSLALLTFLSLAPVAASLAGRLERAYPAFPGDSVAYVVVLGSGHDSDSDLPVSARLSDAGLYRLVEGVRIARAQPWSTLVLSGYGGSDPRPNAEVYRDVAVALGFPVARTVTEGRARATQEEAELLEPVLRGHAFALVTSADHMPRAAALFRARGLEPIPAPTGHLSPRVAGRGLVDLVPSEIALAVTRHVWYETLGRVWARARGAL